MNASDRPEAHDPTPAGVLNSFASRVRGNEARAVDLTLARLNADVYTSGHDVDGWLPLDDRQLQLARIDPNTLHDERAGFHARIYGDQQGHYVLTFRGTDEGRDWVHNVRQGIGLQDRQYDLAIDLAKKARQAFGEDLVITGHSLGGGLAAAGAIATDTPAVTFNAAGLHENTLERLGLDPAAVRRQMDHGGLIRRYAVDNEILTGLQERNLLTRGLLPDAVGHKLELPDPDPVRGFRKLIPGNALKHGVEVHGMDAVIEAQQLAARGSIDHAAHPSNGMFNDALAGLKGINAGALGLSTETEYRNAAGALVARAHQAGLHRIDHVVVGANGVLFAVEGALDGASRRIAGIDKAQAAAQPLEASSQQVQLQRTDATDSQAQRPETRQGVALTP